jgi:hypothetical protein
VSFTDWLLADIRLPKGIHGSPEPEHAWWSVMCLTGVDYFSTLGYPPGIAFLAAGLLSPVATLVLVLVTLFGALPVTGGWRRQARMCRAASGCWRSFSLKWGGKSLVLILLGFANYRFRHYHDAPRCRCGRPLRAEPVYASLDEKPDDCDAGSAGILGGVFLKGFEGGVEVFLFTIFDPRI